MVQLSLGHMLKENEIVINDLKDRYSRTEKDSQKKKKKEMLPMILCTLCCFKRDWMTISRYDAQSTDANIPRLLTQVCLKRNLD